MSTSHVFAAASKSTMTSGVSRRIVRNRSSDVRQLGLDQPLLLERLVERAVLGAEVLHGVVAPRDRDRHGDREHREQQADEQHEHRQRDPEQPAGRGAGADVQIELLPAERHGLLPTREPGGGRGGAEHRLRPRPARHQDERQRRTRDRQGDLEVDRGLAVRGQRGEPHLVRVARSRRDPMSVDDAVGTSASSSAREAGACHPCAP